MESTTYERVAANVAQVDVDGGTVRVSWKCPATGRAVGESTASMQPDASVTGRVRASVKRGVVAEVIYGAARFLAGRIGGAAGRVVNDAVYTAASDLNSKASAGSEYTEASRRAAIVSAFETVKEQFAWDAPTGRYIAR
jgi:hypothetical protein